MSQENVELVKAFVPTEIDLVEVLASDDPATVFVGDISGVVDPDIEVIFEPSSVGGPGLEFRGLDGLLEGWRDWLLPWESYRITVEDFVDAGENVILAARVVGRTERHGVEMEHDPAAVWTFRDGKLIRVRFFLERAEAFKAVEAG
jgi:SnoaL-like domain